MEFQSLLSWMGHRNRVAAIVIRAGHVSILVVVDGSPQQLAGVPRAVDVIGFNPCCRGWVTATQPAAKWTATSFQSLLSWIGHRNDGQPRT